MTITLLKRLVLLQNLQEGPKYSFRPTLSCLYFSLDRPILSDPYPKQNHFHTQKYLEFH